LFRRAPKKQQIPPLPLRLAVRAQGLVGMTNLSITQRHGIRGFLGFEVNRRGFLLGPSLFVNVDGWMEDLVERDGDVRESAGTECEIAADVCGDG
jgi:hypothetical protein